jgi:hypothetical protein
MVAYIVYGLLFLGGLVVLGLLTAGRFDEDTGRRQRPPNLLRLIMVLGFLFLLLQLIPFLLHVRVHLFVAVSGIVLVGLVLLSALLVVRARIRDEAALRRREEATMLKLVQEVEAAPEDVDAHARLAKAFENLKMFTEATREYHSAWKLCPKEAVGYSSELRSKEKSMAALACSGREECTVICPQCESRARPEQRRCLRCGTLLYTSELQWVWRNVPLSLRIAAIAVIAVSLVYVTWVPLTYSLTLMGIWLTIVLYLAFRWRSTEIGKEFGGG